MKNLKRAAKRREMRKFKIGDWVTWGARFVPHQVVEVKENGVVVDVSSEKDAEHWAAKQADGRFFLTVLYDHNTQGHTMRCRFQEHAVCAGPPEKVDIEEWRAQQADHKLRYRW